MKNDDFLNEIMAQSDLKMPFSDFENEVMQQIQKQEQRRKTFSKNLVLSWTFFALGSACGIAISLLLPSVNIAVSGITNEHVTIVFQIVFVLFVMLQLESLLTSTKQALKFKKDPTS